MKTHVNYLVIAAGLLLGKLAHAQNWFTVITPGPQATTVLVEVDLDSVHSHGTGGEGVIRVTHDAERPHAAGFRYRSFIATAQFDCQRRSISFASAAYFAQAAGQGLRVGADSSGREAGMPPGLLDSVPARVRQALLRATCATVRSY
jgi:hypothetical protein